MVRNGERNHEEAGQSRPPLPTRQGSPKFWHHAIQSPGSGKNSFHGNTAQQPAAASPQRAARSQPRTSRAPDSPSLFAPVASHAPRSPRRLCPPRLAAAADRRRAAALVAARSVVPPLPERRRWPASPPVAPKSARSSWAVRGRHGVGETQGEMLAAQGVEYLAAAEVSSATMPARRRSSFCRNQGGTGFDDSSTGQLSRGYGTPVSDARRRGDKDILKWINR